MKVFHRKNGWAILLLLALSISIGCGNYYLYIKQREKLAKEEREEILKTMLSTEFTGEIDAKEPAVPKEIRHGKQVNFHRLQKINEELYAWIYIPNTKVDGPIAQSASDNAYYLTHNLNKELEFAGCFYTENYNHKDFKDPNTIIYGHNMKNQSMFGSLHRFEEKEFFEKNENIYIYTPKKILTYQIFAAYEYDDRHIMKTYDFWKKSVYESYLKSIYKVNTMISNYREGVSVTKKDHILTLSTCASGRKDRRYLVQAVLKADEQKN